MNIIKPAALMAATSMAIYTAPFRWFWERHRDDRIIRAFVMFVSVTVFCFALLQSMLAVLWATL